MNTPQMLYNMALAAFAKTSEDFGGWGGYSGSEAAPITSPLNEPTVPAWQTQMLQARKERDARGNLGNSSGMAQSFDARTGSSSTTDDRPLIHDANGNMSFYNSPTAGATPPAPSPVAQNNLLNPPAVPGSPTANSPAEPQGWFGQMFGPTAAQAKVNDKPTANTPNPSLGGSSWSNTVTRPLHSQW